MSSDENVKKLDIKAGVKSRTIHVDYLARVEGEGALYLKTKGDEVETVELKIFEPPRFFEGFLRGRSLFEAPDITARICGICPVAYQMSSVHAMEDALGVEIPEHIHQLRRLLYCGEWIESHGLHMYMLHAPDFFGCQDAIELSKKNPEIIKKGLRLKKVGNDIIRVLAGREIHPINVRVGGFYTLPEKKAFSEVIEQLKQAREDAIETIHWVNGFDFPHLERSYEFVSLASEREYPMSTGRIISSSGLDISVQQFDQYFEEEHVKHSTALHAVMKDKGAYFVGPMARYNLCQKQLSSIVHEVIKEIGFEDVCVNPFRSIIVRALEILYACDEALRIFEEVEWDGKKAFVEAELKAGVGFSATEAPRGLLFHRYAVNEKGMIDKATIVAPTSQNQKTIEEDLHDFVKENLSMPDDELVWKCEQAIRNYDPCISCSAHFLKLERCNAK